MRRFSCRYRGFTLVELLVVIAIIGVLVSLLLPAVNAAREAARRTQCMNQSRQMGLAMINLENALGIYPGGGIEPWPAIEDYSSNGKALGPDKQGLSWGFQILPYLEENAVHDLNTTEQIESTPIPLYFCPSRRPPTVFPGSNRWLMDYAALVPSPSRSRIPNRMNTLLNNARGCSIAYAFWGVPNYSNDFNPRSSSELRHQYLGFWGVVVRSSYLVQGDGTVKDLDYTPLVSPRKIKDGLSKTAVVAEKRIRIGITGASYDDRGWSDGWDLDTLSSTLCPPTPDQRTSLPGRGDAITAGSAHDGGMNVVYIDGAVAFQSYGIDLETWNRIANREDGEVTLGTD